MTSGAERTAAAAERREKIRRGLNVARARSGKEISAVGQQSGRAGRRAGIWPVAESAIRSVGLVG